MRSISDYIKIASKAVEQIKKESGRLKVACPEKHILPELCEALHKTVMDFIPLRIFCKNNNLSTRDYTLYLQYVLPQFFSNEDLQEYFLEMLVRQHNNAESWTRPCSRKDFEKIVGLKIYNDAPGENRMMPSRYHWIMCIYKYTYNELFTYNLQYPRDLVEEVERCFAEMVPMPHTYKMYADLYLGMRGVPYLDFIAQVLYLRYGDNKMEAYLNAVIKQYISTLGAYHDGQANFQDIIHYTFGCRYARSAFEMSPYKARYKSLDTPGYRFKTLLLRTAWPYTYANHASCRDSVYTMMRLTEQEKLEYDEKYFGKRVRWNMASRAKVNVDYNDLHLPYRSTYDEIKAVVKRYYTLNVLPKRLIPRRYVALKEIVLMSAPMSTIARDIKYMERNTSLTPVLYALMDDEENLLRVRYAESNHVEILTDKDIIHIYFFNKGRYQYRSINYTVLNSLDFLQEAKMYCRKVLGEKVSLPNIAKIKKCIQFMADMNERFHVKRCKDVTAGYICIWLHRRQCDGIKPGTITEDLYTIRNLMDTIMGYKGYALRPQNNPAQYLRFFGAHDHIKNRPIIPDDILIFLDDHAWELDEEWRLFYRILRETAWRFDDVANLRVDGIYDIEDAEYFGIRTDTSKTRKQRRRSGLGDYIEDVISAELYHELQDYIAGTDTVRKKYETDNIFFSCYGGLAHQENAHTFNAAVNELLRRHGIKSIDSTYTSFTSAQTRATGATELIEAGVDLPIVQNKLGHLNPETTAKHYARVQEKRRAELDKEFFDQKFGELFDPEKLALLTEKERAALYDHFDLGGRKVEFGTCRKEPCGGTCLRHGSAECVECTKLLTGPQNLPAWQEYLEDSERRLKEMTAAYDARGISQDIYVEFKEYKETVRRRNAFQDVITKITSWKESRG